MQTTAFQKSGKRQMALFAVRKHVRRADLADGQRSALFATASRWMKEHLQYLAEAEHAEPIEMNLRPSVPEKSYSLC